MLSGCDPAAANQGHLVAHARLDEGQVRLTDQVEHVHDGRRIAEGQPHLRQQPLGAGQLIGAYVASHVLFRVSPVVLRVLIVVMSVGMLVRFLLA